MNKSLSWIRRKKIPLMGFTLLEFMFVVAIIGLFIAIAVPNFVKARNRAREKVCDNNLRLLGHGEEQYMVDNNLTAPVTLDVIISEGYLRIMPECPAGGIYTFDPARGTISCDAIDHGTYDIGEGLVTHD